MARRSRVRPAPKTKVWLGLGLADTTIVASGDAVVASLNAAALSLRPFTIMRTRALLSWESDQLAADEAPLAAFGMGVFNDTAVALGSTGIPDPDPVSGDPNASWFVHRGLQCSQTLATAIGFVSPGAAHFEVDSKAMRKVGDQEDVAVVISEINAFGAIFSMIGRILIQLH